MILPMRTLVTRISECIHPDRSDTQITEAEALRFEQLWKQISHSHTMSTCFHRGFGQPSPLRCPLQRAECVGSWGEKSAYFAFIW